MEAKSKSKSDSPVINDCYSSSERSNSPEIDLIDDNNSNDTNESRTDNKGKDEDISCNNGKRKRYSISSEASSSSQSPKPLSLLSSAKSATPASSKPQSVTDHSISQLLGNSYSNNHNNNNNKTKSNDNLNKSGLRDTSKGSSPPMAHNNCQSQHNLTAIPVGDKLFRPFQV